MNKKSMSVLKKLYRATNYVYDRERAVSLYQESSLSEREQELLKEMNWQVNQLEWLSHDICVTELIKLRNEQRLDRQRIIDSFIAGVGGSYPRGISPLISYYTMQNIPKHHYEEADRYACCQICSFANNMKNGFWENTSFVHYVLYLGNAYGTNPWGALLDLKELAEQPPIKPTKEDIVVFQNLLSSLNCSSSNETPGQFEKRLTAEKIMPKSTYVRRGILNSLAITGVIPNLHVQLDFNSWTNFIDKVSHEEKLNNTKGRSDMEMPWAGWTGELKVNWDAALELFGEEYVQIKA